MGHALVTEWNECRVMERVMPGLPSGLNAENGIGHAWVSEWNECRVMEWVMPGLRIDMNAK